MATPTTSDSRARPSRTFLTNHTPCREPVFAAGRHSFSIICFPVYLSVKFFNQTRGVKVLARAKAKWPIEPIAERESRNINAARAVNLDPASGRFERYLAKIWQYLNSAYGENGFEIVVEGISTVTHVYAVVACSLEEIPRWTVFVGEIWRIRKRPSYDPAPRHIVGFSKDVLGISSIALDAYGPILLRPSAWMPTCGPRLQGRDLLPLAPPYFRKWH